MIILTIITALASSISEVKIAECRVACRYIGYQTGGYTNDKCYCADYFEYEQLTGYKKTVLPTRVRQAPSTPKWPF